MELTEMLVQISLPAAVILAHGSPRVVRFSLRPSSRHPGCLLGLQCSLFASRHDPCFSLALSAPHNWPSKLLSVPEASVPPSGHPGLPHSSIFPRSKPRALHVSSHEG